MSEGRDETGAVAVLVGLLAIALFAFSALAVDLGNAFVRKRDAQRQVDFAALAGGAALGGDQATVVDAVREQLVGPSDLNLVQDDTPLDQALPPLTSLALLDGDPINGEVQFTTSGLRVTAPKVKVDYYFARAIGFEAADVTAQAEVMIGSPGKALPFYVAESCSFLQQTIVNAPSGLEPQTIPALDPAGDPANNINLTSFTPSETPVNSPVTGAVLTAQGGHSMVGVTKVGFTTEDFGSSSLHEEVPIASAAGSSITLNVPASVYQTEGLWYVRVFKDGAWSEDAVTFKVGDPPLYCEGMESGNFGALQLSRNDASTGTWVAMNTILGIMHDVAKYPLASPPTPCEGYADSSTAYSPSGPFPAPRPVNCVTTEPGTVSQATTGFILGETDSSGTHHDGLFIADESTCDPNGETSVRNVTISGKGSFKLNNDVLTCFFNDPSVTVGQVSAKNGAPDNVVSSEIFKSPRFFWIPVLADDPSGGRSGSWPIIEFRGAFITSQPASASQTDPKSLETNDTENGLVMDNNGIRSLHAVMINEDALPDTADVPGDIISYIGSGPKIIRLVD